MIVKKELDDLTQVLRNWPLKMWRPKDRSMTVVIIMPGSRRERVRHHRFSRTSRRMRASLVVPSSTAIPGPSPSTSAYSAASSPTPAARASSQTGPGLGLGLEGGLGGKRASERAGRRTIHARVLVGYFLFFSSFLLSCFTETFFFPALSGRRNL